MTDAGKARLWWLDSARTIALLAMIVFHSARDLEIFGVLPAGTTMTGGWAIFSRVIAGSFLFIAGLAFVLAHQHGFRIKAWAKRLALIFGAAGLVSVATFITFPERFIYFGILHAIGFASIAGLIFLQVPFWLTAACALVVLGVGSLQDNSLFQSAWLSWTGLSSTFRPSLDFIPVFPWLGSFLLGMTVAQYYSLGQTELVLETSSKLRVLNWPGRHSLAIYLAHQPILLALIWLTVALRP